MATVVRPLEVYGLASRIVLTPEGPRAGELRAALETAWQRCLVPWAGRDGAPALEAEEVRVRLLDEDDQGGAVGEADQPGVVGSDLASVLQMTTQAVTYAAIGAQAGRLVMLHAGACANLKTGAAVAFVAPGGTGKTTLARKLGRLLGYITDETVGIMPDGDIVAYEKPLSIRPEGGAGAKIETSPDQLGLLRPPQRPWLRRVVLLRRSSEHEGPPSWTELDLADAIVALAPESSSLSSLPRPLQVLADLLDRSGPVLRCDYRESDEILATMCELVAGE